MYRLICFFAGYTGLSVGFVMAGSNIEGPDQPADMQADLDLSYLRVG